MDDFNKSKTTDEMVVAKYYMKPFNFKTNKEYRFYRKFHAEKQVKNRVSESAEKDKEKEKSNFI